MRRRRAAWVVVVALLASIVGCDSYTWIEQPTAPATVGSGAPVSDLIVEFRVEGNYPNVTVRVDNSLDGLTQTSSVLPYSHFVSIGARDSAFLSLTARASGPGFLHGAIFINGIVFRQSSSEAPDPLINVSGTWRR